MVTKHSPKSNLTAANRGSPLEHFAWPYMALALVLYSAFAASLFWLLFN